MSKFIVVKMKNLLYFIFILSILFFTILILYFFLFKNTSTFSSNSNVHNTAGYDLDGDSLKDKVTLIENNDSLQVKIQTFENEYLLKSSKNDTNLFTKCSYYKIKTHFVDLTRDNLPELILTGMKDNHPICYIFKWTTDNFINIYTSTNNIFGIINSNNSKMPIEIDTNLPDKASVINSNIFLADTTKDLCMSKLKVPALNSIEKFIDLIEYPYEIIDTPDIFADFISSSELSLLWNLNKSSTRYTFVSGYFYDIDWDNSGTPSTILWSLTFKKSNIIDDSSPEEEFILNVQTDLNELSEYKISSIQK